MAEMAPRVRDFTSNVEETLMHVICILTDLVDFSNTIQDEPKMEILSSDMNFLSSQVCHMVHFE